MAFDPATLSPAQAWEPIAPSQWDDACATHLLRRMGFSAPPAEVARVRQQGLPATLAAAFDQIRPMPLSGPIADYIAQKPAMIQRGLAAQKAHDAKTLAEVDDFFQPVRRAAYRSGIELWFEFARAPANSAQENLFLFLSSVLVVAINKIDNPDWIFPYFALLRESLQRPYPDLCKSLPHTPAMCAYLDLSSSARGIPNENYARELMELFTLGEGHYTETDVKEAARALTGFYLQDNQIQFSAARWDPGDKTLFGRTGPWGADDVVNLIFTQSSARTWLPTRFLAWYLSDNPVPQPYLETLGTLWQQQDWRLDSLAKIVLSSKMFYAAAFRGNLIKSPVRYYLGMCQDLGVDVLPFPSELQGLLNDCGQDPLNPPNVRGWLGGQLWLNPSTWTARRHLLEIVFTSLPDSAFSAEDFAVLQQARARGCGRYFVDPYHFQELAALPPDQAADRLVNRFLLGAPADSYRVALADYLKNTDDRTNELLRNAVMDLLASPLYQQC